MAEGSGQRQRYCTNCGAEIRCGYSFCTSCGTLLIPGEDLSHQAHLPVSYGLVRDGAEGLAEDRVSVFFVLVPTVYYGWRGVGMFQ